MSTPRVVVVGLGPAGSDLLLPRARATIGRVPVRFVRTRRHPAVEELASEGVAFVSLDHHYESAADLEAAYAGIVEELASAAREHGEVLYAVPGNPAVAERTLPMLREAGVEVEAVPGLSFVDYAWARLGVDPLGGARVLDGRSLTRADLLMGGRVLIGQCDSRAVLSDVKLSLLEALAPDAKVTVLAHLGLPDESVTEHPLAELDRTVEPDHLTSLSVDLGEGAGRAFAELLALVELLRGPGGCPWDAEQTHHSLRRHLIEETYEVVEAIEALPAGAPGADEPVEPDAYRQLAEELGDLAFQVLFHATLAREADAFVMADVLEGIHDKLVRRHPHVFGAVEVEDAAEVARNWEQIKQREKGDEEGVTSSLVASVPESLPSLLAAHKLLRKASSVGLELMSAREGADAVDDAVRRVAGLLGDPSADASEVEVHVGEALAALALIARSSGFDAEGALRGWTRRFRRRLEALETLARQRGVELSSAGPDEVSALWIEAGDALRP